MRITGATLAAFGRVQVRTRRAMEAASERTAGIPGIDPEVSRMMYAGLDVDAVQVEDALEDLVDQFVIAMIDVPAEMLPQLLTAMVQSACLLGLELAHDEVPS